MQKLSKISVGDVVGVKWVDVLEEGDRFCHSGAYVLTE